jgi:hypothetical protein
MIVQNQGVSRDAACVHIIRPISRRSPSSTAKSSSWPSPAGFSVSMAPAWRQHGASMAANARVGRLDHSWMALGRTVEGMFVVLQIIVGRTGPLKKRGCPSVYRRGASLLVQGHARLAP